MEQENDIATEKKREPKLQTEDKNHSGGCDVQDKKMREVKEPKSVERQPSSENAVPEFSSTFAQIALQLVSRRPRKKFENIIQLASDANSLTQKSFFGT